MMASPTISSTLYFPDWYPNSLALAPTSYEHSKQSTVQVNFFFSPGNHSICNSNKFMCAHNETTATTEVVQSFSNSKNNKNVENVGMVDTQAFDFDTRHGRIK